MPTMEIDSHSHSNPCDDPTMDSASMQLNSTNVQYVEQRDQEIQQVLHSMEDMNRIFADVAHLVSNQVGEIRRLPAHIRTL